LASKCETRDRGPIAAGLELLAGSVTLMGLHSNLRYDSQQYDVWVKAHDNLADKDRQAIGDSIRRLAQSPVFSIISLPASRGGMLTFHSSVASVRQQLYPHWELWLPDGAAASHADERLRILPGTEAPASDYASLFNSGLAAAGGEFVLPLPSDVALSESALYELAIAVAESRQAELLYTDEDRLDAAGARCMPRFKTGWDPDLALGCDAIGLLVAYRKALLDRLGGMRSRASSVAIALYDLSLRAASATYPNYIRHVPTILCHRLGSLEASLVCDAEETREIVRKHLSACGVSASVVPAPLAPRWNRVIRELPSPVPLVSVIVPIRDRPELLERCADAVLSRTDYPALELLVVDNDSRELATARLLRHLLHDSRVRVIPYPGGFNYSALNNLAARQARGDILVLLNNDTDSIRPDWLREMVSHAVRPDVGAVGAKLLYADGRVQHAGVVLGPGPVLTHQLRFADCIDAGPAGELALTRTVSAVTGACLAIRRSVFFEVGGLNEQMKAAFNDIDLCLRLGDHGYRIVWTPFAELFHLESASRGYNETSDQHRAFAIELGYFCRFWSSLLDTDPFHNPNLVYGWDSTLLSSPPRRRRPWLT
jgi:O-antigen biosynthesis protein